MLAILSWALIRTFAEDSCRVDLQDQTVTEDPCHLGLRDMIAYMPGG